MPTYKRVPELNGIEIYFEKKPHDEICEELKNNGWRWHYTKRCWYTRFSKAAEDMAKKLCNNEPFTPKSEIDNLGVSVNQYYRNVHVATVTITKNNGKFFVSSTNNMIICADCNNFFSVHAAACPFCGCPLAYTAEHDFYRFHPSALKKREYEINQRSQEMLNLKKQRIRELESYCDISRNFTKLLELDDALFEKAISRAMHLDDINESLPNLDNWVWWNLLTLNDFEYLQKIEDLKEEYSRIKIQDKADRVQRKIEQLKIQSKCKEYGISQNTIERLIERNTSYDDVIARLELIQYYLETYPKIGLSYDHHVFYPLDLLKKQIQQVISSGTFDEEVLLENIGYIDDFDIPF